MITDPTGTEWPYRVHELLTDEYFYKAFTKSDADAIVMMTDAVCMLADTGSIDWDALLGPR